MSICLRASLTAFLFTVASFAGTVTAGSFDLQSQNFATGSESIQLTASNFSLAGFTTRPSSFASELCTSNLPSCTFNFAQSFSLSGAVSSNDPIQSVTYKGTTYLLGPSTGYSATLTLNFSGPPPRFPLPPPSTTASRINSPMPLNPVRWHS